MELTSYPVLKCNRTWVAIEPLSFQAFAEIRDSSCKKIGAEVS